MKKAIKKPKVKHKKDFKVNRDFIRVVIGLFLVGVLLCFMSVKANATEQVEGFATSYFITEDGYAVTNCHVACDVSYLELNINGKTYTAHLVVADRDNDVAIIKADLHGDKVKVLPISSVMADQGTEVVVSGFPLGLRSNPQTDFGTINKLVGSMPEDNTEPLPNRYIMDVDINPGSSGSPVVANGAVIGTAEGALMPGGIPTQGQSIMVASKILLNLVKQVPGLKVKSESILDSMAFNSMSNSQKSDYVSRSVAFVTIYVDDGSLQQLLSQLGTTGPIDSFNGTNNNLNKFASRFHVPGLPPAAGGASDTNGTDQFGHKTGPQVNDPHITIIPADPLCVSLTYHGQQIPFCS